MTLLETAGVLNFTALHYYGIHWCHVSQFLLPSYALLTAHVLHQSKFMLSFLESFMDNLPFEGVGSLPFWAISFSECLKYTLSREELAKQCSKTKLVGLLLQSVELVMAESRECQEVIVALVLWIMEKALLFEEENICFLLDSLQLTLINKRPVSDELCGLLLTSTFWRLRAIHVALLRVPPLCPEFVSPLLTCSEDYLAYVVKNIDIIALLSKEVQPSSAYASVVLRIIRSNTARFQDLNLSTANFTPFIFPLFSTEDWQLIIKTLASELVPCLRRVILQWEKTVELESAIKVLQHLEVPHRGEIVSVILNEQDFSTYFLSELMKSIELPEELTREFSVQLFRAIFFCDVTDDELDSVLKTLSQFPPCERLIHNILKCYLEGAAEQEIPLLYSFGKLQRIGFICSQLLYTDRRYLTILPSQDDLLAVLTVFDSFVESDVIAKYGLFGGASIDISQVDLPSTEEELLQFMENAARRTVIYLSIDCIGADVAVLRSAHAKSINSSSPPYRFASTGMT
ncbi:hypothetical protein Y032_0037g3405 [Ancylostoma ceylanicum]|uniref:Uncharacterized protein n=1 Tax=Ancylostoma ceylanicum TaxID=53326 RepID=A0A016UK57_9BILA|nr:hypothetical protein Y032_0037g3405 [Ancylostoma ceylanicum]